MTIDQKKMKTIKIQVKEEGLTFGLQSLERLWPTEFRNETFVVLADEEFKSKQSIFENCLLKIIGNYSLFFRCIQGKVNR